MKILKGLFMYLRNFLAILSLVPALCCINDANAMNHRNVLSSHHEDTTNFNNINICGSCTYMFNNGKIKFSKENKSEKEIKQILLENKNIDRGGEICAKTVSIDNYQHIDTYGILSAREDLRIWSKEFTSFEKSKIKGKTIYLRTPLLLCDDLYIHSNESAEFTLFSPDGLEYLKITGISDDGILLNTCGKNTNIQPLRFNRARDKFVPSGILNIMGKCSIKIMN